MPGTNSMITSQSTEEEKWYVMRAYKNEKKAEELLSGNNGLKYFIPKRQILRTRNGRKIICTEPVIHSLVFVFASQKQIVNFKRYICNDLQFVSWKRYDSTSYLTIPAKQMDDFIRMCTQKEQEVTFYTPDEIPLKKGQKVRVHGGIFDKMEGILVKTYKKRNKQLVVIIPDILAASANVDPEYLEIIP